MRTMTSPSVLSTSRSSANVLAIASGAIVLALSAYFYFGPGWPYFVHALGLVIEDSIFVFFLSFAIFSLIPATLTYFVVNSLLQRGTSWAFVRFIFSIYLACVVGSLLIRVNGTPATGLNINLLDGLRELTQNPETPLIRLAVFVPLGMFLFQKLSHSWVSHLVVVVVVALLELLQMSLGLGAADLSYVVYSYAGVVVGLCVTEALRFMGFGILRVDGRCKIATPSWLRSIGLFKHAPTVS